MTRELLFSVTKDDLDIQTFRSGKGGGQRRDKVETAVRIIHRESGAIGYSQDQRSLEQNKKIAFKRLIENPIFILWRKKKAYELTNTMIDIEEVVEKSMRPEYIQVEYKDENGVWYVSDR